ncbi:hypothetical protein KP509_32G018800 [Ceratopteris richardii]|uniref:Omega-3 fatty acid desaturase n=1 Tax=Ceratopteris richardii TaxID=49495 RepID=A0A8T2QTK6_CERRI|nr:hypothetical protein KP509_32G018800 [Ceratopteris richardii]
MASPIFQCRCSFTAGPSSSLQTYALTSSLRGVYPNLLFNRQQPRQRRQHLVSAVAAPPRPSPAPPVEENDDNRHEILSEEKSARGFSAADPPPFTLADIRAAIPKHCWVKDPWKSFSYVVRDVAIVLGLAAGAAYLNNWVVWPLYWFAQGTMFWALFVLGHDCGHGSFSNNKKLNDVVGHLTHSSILVPYHGWRISHRTHHQNHGHVENDESWHPLCEKLYRSLDTLTRMARFSPLSMLAYPLYLWGRSPGKTGSHYHPSSPLFMPNEKNEVLTSTICWFSMVTLLVGLAFALGPILMLKLYVVPYWFGWIW